MRDLTEDGEEIMEAEGLPGDETEDGEEIMEAEGLLRVEVEVEIEDKGSK